MIASVAPNEPLSVPEHPDGPEGWAYAVIDGRGQTVFADNAGELVALFVNGYDAIPQTDEGDDEALAARYEVLVQMAEVAQRGIVDRAVEDGTFDPVEAGEEALTGLFAPRSLPWGGFWTRDGAARFEWDGGVPIVVLATDYEPYTDRPAPTGNVLVVDPYTELTFLQSLGALGLVKFLVAS
jgi:hypothetical protein